MYTISDAFGVSHAGDSLKDIVVVAYQSECAGYSISIEYKCDIIYTTEEHNIIQYNGNYVLGLRNINNINNCKILRSCGSVVSYNNYLIVVEDFIERDWNKNGF